jgi:hypothetical protein
MPHNIKAYTAYIQTVKTILVTTTITDSSIPFNILKLCIDLLHACIVTYKPQLPVL